jgi:hypothetical protein
MLGMAWGGRIAKLAAVVTTVVLLASGCADGIDQAHSVQTRLGRLEAVGDIDVDVPTADRGAQITVLLVAGVDDAGVVDLIASVDQVAIGEDYPSYRLELLEPGTADALVVDDAFATDARALHVVGSWRRTASAFVGDTTLTYETGRTTVLVTSDGGLAHDVAEASRVALPPKPVTWRFESGPGTVVLDGAVTTDDVDLVERVQRGVVSPSLPVAAGSWRLDRRRTQVELDLRTDLGATPSAELTPAAFGDKIAPLARTAVAAVGQPRRRVVLRLSRPTDDGTDVFAWWTSDRAPVDGRDRLNRGWDPWLAQVATA